ncbi:MAG: alpha/beta fold hydrolase, partial [Pseudomonadota bacterium]|nr:alpha/beta fold hydrolase [Pseudomonadota bacterium]
MRFIVIPLLLLLAACAPQQQSLKSSVELEHIKINQDTFLAPDGKVLPVRSWLPATRPKAVIIALHGFTDYSHAFVSRGMFFSEHGVALYAYDQRGFGQASPIGIWAGETNLTHDLAEFVRQVSNRLPHTPIYLLGESMGAAVALAAVPEADFPPVSGIILEAPALWGAKTMNPVFRATLWMGAHTIPFETVTGRQLKILASNNIAMLQRLGADPLILKAVRLDTLYGIVQLMGKAYDR